MALLKPNAIVNRALEKALLASESSPKLNKAFRDERRSQKSLGLKSVFVDVVTGP